MAHWLERVRQALCGEANRRETVRRHLGHVLRRRTCLELDPLSIKDNRPRGRTMIVQIEMVRQDDFVIGQPAMGGCSYPLAAGEKLQVTLFSGVTRLTGETKCLGRIKIPSGSGGAFYGYRMVLPEVLTPVARRQRARTAAFTVAPEAELRACTGHGGTVRGVVHDLSTTGMQIRSRNALGRVEAGMRMYLSTVLPAPVGELNEMVVVRYLTPNERSDQVIIEVEFEQQLERMNPYARSDVRAEGASRPGPPHRVTKAI